MNKGNLRFFLIQSVIGYCELLNKDISLNPNYSQSYSRERILSNIAATNSAVDAIIELFENTPVKSKVGGR